MANNIFQKALFRTPKYNVFPQDNEVKLSYEIGKLIPVQYWDLGPGDSIRSNINQLTRVAPYLAPLYQRYKIDFHAIAIPHRLAIPVPVGEYSGYYDGFSSFHNLAVSDSERPQMPCLTASQYLDLLLNYSSSGDTIIGSLFDYLGYPTFDYLLRKLQKQKFYPQITDLTAGSGAVGIAESNAEYSFDYFAPSLYQYGAQYFCSILCWIANWQMQSGAGTGFYRASVGGALDCLNEYHTYYDDYSIPLAVKNNDGLFKLTYDEDGDNVIAFELNTARLEELINVKFGSVQACMDAWVQALHLFMLQSISEVSLSETKLSLLPLYAYWSAVYDWYINTNLENNSAKKDDWLASVIGLPFTPDSSGEWDVPSSAFKPFDRYWSNDYFTSAFLTPQSGNAVGLSGVSTIADLRNANSLQEFMEKLIYSGKRVIDVVKTIFGVNSSDLRIDRCQVIGTHSDMINVSDVMQTSQSEIDSQLGCYAGAGISVGRKQFIDFQAEEHTLVMVFMSVRPNALYADQLNHLLIQTDPYDFLIPDFANIGEQPIINMEIFPDLQAHDDSVFGWTRRYASYMYTPSHIHGEFKTTLDYWHSARRFDSVPSLNVEFCKVTSKDDLNRVFAVPGAKEHLYTYLNFNTAISRPLGKFIEYSL